MSRPRLESAKFICYNAVTAALRKHGAAKGAPMIDSWGIFLIMTGTVLVVISVFRHVAKRRQLGDVYDKYIKSIKLPPLEEPNDFGQKMRWAIDIDEPEENKSPGGSEPPADKSS